MMWVIIVVGVSVLAIAALGFMAALAKLFYDAMQELNSIRGHDGD